MRPAFPVPADERQRLAEVAETGVLGSPAESAFDDAVQIAARLCDVPMALVTIVSADEQWFKARVGIDFASTSRDISFCAHALETRELIVPDASRDDRFADNPLVNGSPHIRFYAGVPLHVGEGSAVGTLCVLDRVPRVLTPEQLDALRALARHVSTELRLRRDLATARAASRARDEIPIGIGDDVGRWRLESELGRGGVGVVFGARDRAGALAAVKVLLPQWVRNDEVVERFAREARALALLSSRHVTQIYDVGNLPAESGGLPFIAMEHLHGRDLRQVLDQRGSLPWREAARYLVEACEALGEAHAQSIVHRDVKPSNLFLTDAGAEPPFVKVLDFGIAKLETPPGSREITRDEGTFGSMRYMAPEQMLGASFVDARADVWSLGATLFEAIAGRRPFDGQGDLQICVATLDHAPLSLGAVANDVPKALVDVVDRCLAKPRRERFDDARALKTALAALLG